jgi:hypothetical protein
MRGKRRWEGGVAGIAANATLPPRERSCLIAAGIDFSGLAPLAGSRLPDDIKGERRTLPGVPSEIASAPGVPEELAAQLLGSSGGAAPDTVRRGGTKWLRLRCCRRHDEAGC